MAMAAGRCDLVIWGGRYSIYRPHPGTRGPSDQHLTDKNEARPHMIQWRTDGPAAPWPRRAPLTSPTGQTAAAANRAPRNLPAPCSPPTARPSQRSGPPPLAAASSCSPRTPAASRVHRSQPASGGTLRRNLCYCSTSNHHEEEIQ